MQRSPIANWIPFQLSHSSPHEWIVKWMDLRDIRIIHPFFDETIQVCRFRQLERSQLVSLSSTSFLTEVSEDLLSLEPSSFIFHVSRCGSTLLSQAFSAPDENIVIAEAPLLDEILRADEKQSEINLSTQEAWFRSAIKLMGQQRNFKETDYIIKLDSWHLHFYELLRTWYPQTPFFFLYRRPDEVIASHDKQRGIHAVPGMVNPALLKTKEPAYFGGNFNSYTAQVLEQYYLKLQAIFQSHHPNNYFYDYANGSKKMVEAFSQFSGVPIRNADQVHTRLQYHSKSTQEIFSTGPPVNSEKFFFKDCHDTYEQLRSAIS